MIWVSPGSCHSQSIASKCNEAYYDIFQSFRKEWLNLISETERVEGECYTDHP